MNAPDMQPSPLQTPGELPPHPGTMRDMLPPPDDAGTKLRKLLAAGGAFLLLGCFAVLFPISLSRPAFIRILLALPVSLGASWLLARGILGRESGKAPGAAEAGTVIAVFGLVSTGVLTVIVGVRATSHIDRHGVLTLGRVLERTAKVHLVTGARSERRVQLEFQDAKGATHRHEADVSDAEWQMAKPGAPVQVRYLADQPDLFNVRFLPPQEEEAREHP